MFKLLLSKTSKSAGESIVNLNNLTHQGAVKLAVAIAEIEVDTEQEEVGDVWDDSQEAGGTIYGNSPHYVRYNGIYVGMLIEIKRDECRDKESECAGEDQPLYKIYCVSILKGV